MNAINARAIADKKNAEVANAVHEEMLVYVKEQVIPIITTQAEKGNYHTSFKFPASEMPFTGSAVRKELEARGFAVEYLAKGHLLTIAW